MVYQEEIIKEAVPLILEDFLKDNSSLGYLTSQYSKIEKAELTQIIHNIINDDSLPNIFDNDKKCRYLMGCVMSKVRGRIENKIVIEVLASLIK